MKTNWIALGIIFLLGALLGGFSIYKYMAPGSTSSQNQAKLDTAINNGFKVDTLIKWRDAAGRNHVKTGANQNTFADGTLNGNTVMGGPDTAAKVLGVLIDKVSYWQEVASRMEMRAVKAEQERDSKGNLLPAYGYHDTWKDIVFHTDNATFDVDQRDTVHQVDYWTRKWVLGNRHYFTDIFHADTSIKINGYRRLAINTDHNGGWNIKGQLQAAYVGADGTFIPSAGVELTYGNWELAARYGYLQHLQKWSPIGSLTYNVFSAK